MHICFSTFVSLICTFITFFGANDDVTFLGMSIIISHLEIVCTYIHSFYFNSVMFFFTSTVISVLKCSGRTKRCKFYR